MSDQRESAGMRRSFEKLVLNRLGLQWRWKVAEESMQKTWFPQTPFWGVFVTLIVIYTLAGAYSPSVLTWMDAILTPLVQALGLVGLGPVRAGFPNESSVLPSAKGIFPGSFRRSG